MDGCQVAHNPKVVGSNPTPATIESPCTERACGPARSRVGPTSTGHVYRTAPVMRHLDVVRAAAAARKATGFGE